MKTYLYILSLNLNLMHLNSAFDMLTDLEKQKISSMNIITSFHYTTPDKSVNFLLISKNEMEEYKKILNNNLIPYICEDISNNILENQIDIESKIGEFSDINNIDFQNFMNTLNNWMLENLDLDSILDRINEHGISTLRQIDKKFLERI